MPPKKKKGKKIGTVGELTVEDKYKKTLEEIEALKDHLAVRKQFARRSEEASEEWKERLRKAETDLEERGDVQRAVSADMTRQYRTMQVELSAKLRRVEEELALNKARLERTEDELVRTKESSARLMKEKDESCAELTLKLSTINAQHEALINDQLDRLVEKMGRAKRQWEAKSLKIDKDTRHMLQSLGFGLLDI